MIHRDLSVCASSFCPTASSSNMNFAIFAILLALIGFSSAADDSSSALEFPGSVADPILTRSGQPAADKLPAGQPSVAQPPAVQASATECVDTDCFLVCLSRSQYSGQCQNGQCKCQQQ